jgi:hypothetical protein
MIVNDGPRVVFDGQSLLQTPAERPLPTALMVKCPGYDWTTVAVGGAGWGELGPGATGVEPAARRLFPQVRPGRIDVLFMCGGQGDILDLGSTGAQAYTAATTYKNNAKAAGFDYVVITTMPAMGPQVFPSTPEAPRPTPAEYTAIADYNAAVLGNAGAFDLVMDISTAPLNNATNMTYFAFDRLHFEVMGAERAAQKCGFPFRTFLEAL